MIKFFLLNKKGMYIKIVYRNCLNNSKTDLCIACVVYVNLKGPFWPQQMLANPGFEINIRSVGVTIGGDI